MADDDLSKWWDEDAERINKMAIAARKMAVKLPTEKEDRWEEAVEESRAWCPTGPGGGLDNSCGGAGTAAVVREVLQSIEKTGGFSVHPVSAKSPKTGFMCATVPHAEKIFQSSEEITQPAIQSYLDQHKDFLSENPKLHLGGWIDPDTEKVYLDLSEQFEDEASAVAAGIKHNQLAVWDVANKREVRIRRDDNGKRSQAADPVRLPSGGRSEGDRGSVEQGSRRNAGTEESRDCGRGPGGIFGPGNKCQVEGEGEQPSDSFGNPLDAVMRSPSAAIGGGGGAKADTGWKKDDGHSHYGQEQLQSNPPARSLSGVNTVSVMNGKTLSASLKETGVTLDQAAKVCGNLSPDSNIVIAHGGLDEIAGWMANPSMASEPKPRVTVVSKQPFGGVEDAIGTAATLERNEDDELLLSYTMFSVAPEAQRDNPVAVARGLYSGVVKSINEAEKVGVEEVGMLAAGSDSNDEFKGYRIWPRLGFDGIIPRNRITPTYSVRLGFFERYGSNLPDDILSDKAKQEKSEGALTIQSLYETREGQRWWEQNGGPMGMFLRVGDTQDPGWQRFKRISERVSDRDILDALDIEWRSIREERAFCPTGEGQGTDNSCSSSGGTGTAKVDNSWKKSTGDYSYTPGEGKSPIVGGDDIKSLSISDAAGVAASMKDMKIKSLTDVVAIGGGMTRGASTFIAESGMQDGQIQVMSEVPVDPDDESKGTMTSTVTMGVSEEGEKIVDYSTMHASTDAGTANLTGEDAARMSSILLEKFPESIKAAERAGFDKATTYAMGDAENEFKGYRLWPQFGFDAELYPDIRENIPKDIIPHDAPVTIQELISTPAGDKWWNENGESMAMTLDLKDKKSDGYKRYQRMTKLAERLKKRNEGRSLYDYLMSEERGFCATGEGGGIDNSCGGSSGVNMAPDRDMGSSIATGRVGAGKPEIIQVESQESLGAASSVLGIGGVDDAVTLGGGNVRGAKVDVYADPSGFMKVSSIWPVDADDEASGEVFTEVSMANTSDGKVLGFEAFGPTQGSVATGANQQKVMSIISEKVAESIDAAEKKGFVAVTTFAVGDAKNQYKGYRLWPQFGFDADLPRDLAKRVPPEIVLKAKGIDVPPPGSTSIPHHLVVKSLASQNRDLTIQELISTRDGDRWWDQHGDDIELKLDLTDKSSLGYKKWSEMKDRLPRLRARNETRSFFDSLVEERDDDCGRTPDGKFGSNNKCQEEGEGAATATAGSGALAKAKNVDVMIDGGKTTAVIDDEARTRALEDMASHPMPDGLSAGSTADLWSRTFVERNGSTKTKITSTDPVFPQDRLAMNGTYVAHESVGQYLSMRHEEARAAAGGVGPGAIIDTTQVLPQTQFTYVSDAMSDDVMHAYESGRFDPGFYSKDLEDAMTKMASRHPELATDDNNRFVFTMLTAILSNGQDPTANIADSDGVYEMYKEHGTCMPEGSIAGTRSAAAKTSLALFQSMIDSFGVERTKNLLSGYTTAENVNKTFAKLSEKSSNPEWRERTDSKPWMTDHYKAKDKKTGEALATTNLVKTDSSGEFKDEVVPMASIFGPKIGSFFANLNGRHDFLTMDRWLMRSVGRVTGELITRSTPQGAKSRAEDALEALDVEKWKPSIYMFGVDKQFGVTKQDLLRSLKIQKKTGVIEENGAAYLWAIAAERSHKNTTKPNGGGYGKDPDADKHACHVAGNGLFKSLIHEQQDPRGAQARRSIREVFRSVVKDIEAKYPDRKGKVDVDEVQAILWQYEKNLWKHLGAKVQIDENSLYSKAADDLLTGKTKERKFKPESRSELLEALRDIEGSNDDWQFQAEQESWDSDIGESGIDFNELFLELERLVSTEEDRSALESARDAVVELRSAGLTTIVMPNAGREGLHVMGFDADIPKDIAETLPETLSHCKTLLDLHVSSEGRSWWEQNGRDIDVAIDLEGVQGQVFDGFATGKTFSDIIEEGILDDYGNS